MSIDYPGIIQFIKYALAGGVAAVTHILVFHAVAWKLFPALQERDFVVRYLDLDIGELDDTKRARNSMYSNVIAFLVSNMVAYILNIIWVFKAGKYNIFVEIILFYCVSGISMVLGTVLMGILIKRFGMLTTYAFFSNMVTAVMINYAVRKYFIFYG